MDLMLPAHHDNSLPVAQAF